VVCSSLLSAAFDSAIFVLPYYAIRSADWWKKSAHEQKIMQKMRQNNVNIAVRYSIPAFSFVEPRICMLFTRRPDDS
jgi:hypothetical protein